MILCLVQIEPGTTVSALRVSTLSHDLIYMPPLLDARRNRQVVPVHKRLYRNMAAIGLIEAQRVTAVLEETLEKLSFLDRLVTTDIPAQLLIFNTASPQMY